MIQFRTDHTQLAGNGNRAKANIYFTGNIIKVDPASVLSSHNAFGSEYDTILASIELPQSFLNLCNGECPKHRFNATESGETSLNALCAGYKMFFSHSAPYMEKMKELLTHYKGIQTKTLEDIIDFHCQFERIHPFQDGNGRVGRLIMFKECLANNIVPFIITDELKLFYYRGLSEWGQINGYLTDTCLTAQDQYKALLDYFKVKY